ncbi:protein ALP1-like [Prosopis cineraria]|uniref:protein ALP1-like n=1 Tax=Prosopis cineraria TaxID=364024 RepID=UPI00241096FD|nr:protein ALP1-like [Prosopis cineraria]
MLVDEQVAIFLHILAHHMKNRVIQFEFGRSRKTISRYFNIVAKAVVRLQYELFKIPEPILEDSTDERWKWFKGCLGVLDGTHIKAQVPAQIKGRYQNRKGDITTNVLGVCSPNGEFIFVFPGWEGSITNSRVLRDAISRPNGFKVPQGNYYLVDAGYPESPQECFNMRHSSARNVIERAFGILKMRWAILRSPSYYPIRTQNRYILACCLLHNLIMRDNVDDPIEAEFDAIDSPNPQMGINPISTMEPSNAWSAFQENMANEMFNAFTAHRTNR